jgi:GNAT superfamily N-acetyltransferase
MKREEEMAEYEVRGARTDDELRAANDLMAKTQLPNYWDSLGWLESAGPVWADVEREHTRVALAAGELVGALRLLPLTLRIGRARLGAVGVGWVSTPPARRNRGVASALMRDALDYTRDRGAPFSLLYGVPDLYHRFGYVTMLPEYSVVVESAAVPGSYPGFVLMRPVTRDDIPELMGIHQAHEAGVSCSIVRTAEHYRSQFVSAAPKTPYWCDWPAAKALFDEHGNLAAYFMPQTAPAELHIKELGVTDCASCGALLHAAMAMARETGLRRVRFHVPPYHPFARYLEGIDSVHQARHFGNREGMMALTGLEACLNAMQPEWTERVRQNGLEGATRECTLVVGEAAFRVVLEESGLCIKKGPGKNPLPLSPGEFIRLLVGYSHTEDVLAEKTPCLKGEDYRFVTALFPKRTPFIWPIDHF